MPPYYFYDIQGHAFTDLLIKIELVLVFIMVIDDFEYGPIAINGDWGNETASLNIEDYLMKNS